MRRTLGRLALRELTRAGTALLRQFRKEGHAVTALAHQRRHLLAHPIAPSEDGPDLLRRQDVTERRVERRLVERVHPLPQRAIELRRTLDMRNRPVQRER